MVKLFIEGGSLFMGTLTLVLLIIAVLSVVNALYIAKREYTIDEMRSRLSYIKSVGLFGLIFGILGQLVGLYQAFQAIQQIGDVSPALLAGGLKVSMIPTLYGAVIFLISYLLWFGLRAFSSNSMNMSE